jgi:hypothetical protein
MPMLICRAWVVENAKAPEGASCVRIERLAALQKHCPLAMGLSIVAGVLLGWMPTAHAQTPAQMIIGTWVYPNSQFCGRAVYTVEEGGTAFLRRVLEGELALFASLATCVLGKANARRIGSDSSDSAC